MIYSESNLINVVEIPISTSYNGDAYRSITHRGLSCSHCWDRAQQACSICCAHNLYLKHREMRSVFSTGIAGSVMPSVGATYPCSLNFNMGVHVSRRRLRSLLLSPFCAMEITIKTILLLELWSSGAVHWEQVFHTSLVGCFNPINQSALCCFFPVENCQKEFPNFYTDLHSLQDSERLCFLERYCFATSLYLFLMWILTSVGLHLNKDGTALAKISKRRTLCIGLGVPQVSYTGRKNGAGILGHLHGG